MKLARAQQPELEALFSIALSYEDTRLTPPSDTTVHFSGAWHFSGWQMEELCLHVSHRETAALQIDYDYQVQSFSEAGEDRVLYAFNPQAAAVCSSTLTARWRQIAENQGQTIAIVDQDRNLTFAQLNAQAEALAAQILTLPQEKPLRIALLLPRGEALITGMLAAMLSHAVWINLDPAQPANRLKTLLAQTGADLIISSCALCGRPASLHAAGDSVYRHYLGHDRNPQGRPGRFRQFMQLYRRDGRRLSAKSGAFVMQPGVRRVPDRIDLRVIEWTKRGFR